VKKNDLQKVIDSIKVQDLKGKVLMLDASFFSVEDAQNLHDGLQDSGMAGLVILPAGAKYDAVTKEELKKMVESL
jgi:hypothetical protein